MWDGPGPPGLRYLGERRVPLAARRTVEVPSVRSGRLLWTENGGLLAVGDGVRGRWSCRLAPGELLLLCPAEQVWVTSLSDHAGELRLFQFEAIEEGRARGMAQWIPPVPVRVPGVELALQALAGAGGNGAPGGNCLPAGHGAHGPGTGALIDFFRTQAQFYELMAAYLSGARQRRAQGSLLSYADQVRRQMAAHCEREYSIELIARNSGVSPHRFYQAFRALTGLTPHKYLSALRLRKALRLLAGDFRSVAEVAHAVGYADEFYFSRVFKRELGLAPSAFVRLVRARPEVEAMAGDLAIFGLAAPPDEAAAPVADAGTDDAGAGPRGDAAEAPWTERVQRLGLALGLETVAGHWLALMDRRLCHLKSLVRRRFQDARFVVVGVGRDGYRVFGARHPGLGDLLYLSAGFIPCRGVRGLGESSAASLAEVAGFGCTAALFLVQGEDRPALQAEWADAVQGDGARCLVAGWSGADDATAYERLVEQLTMQLLEPDLAEDTRG